MLRIEHLTKVYPNGSVGLRDVSFEVDDGEFLVVIGLSGSGKSTLLRCINRLIEPTEGKIFWDETELTAASAAEMRRIRRHIGMVFQQFNLVKRSSVLTNVLSGRLGYVNPWLSLLGWWPSEEHDRARRALERVGIAEKAASRADALSGGQQQRVGIARALMQEPRLLLADEPVASLDPVLAHSILHYLEMLNKTDGTTVICSLHFLDLVHRYATRVIGLKDGLKVFEGRPTDIDRARFKEIYGEEAQEVRATALGRRVTRPAWPLGVLSLFLPGLGQAARGSLPRGLAVFAAVASTLGVTVWYRQPVWYIAPALLWLWNIWDACSPAAGAPVLPAALLWLGMAYGIGWQVTEIDPGALFRNTERGAQIVRLLIKPDLIAPRQEVLEASVRILIPCGPNPPRAANIENGVSLAISPDCAGVNEMIVLTADGLWPDYPVELIWRSAIGSYRQLGGTGNELLVLQSDGGGHLSAVFAVPSNALIEAGIDAAPDRHMVVLTQRRPLGGYTLSRNGAFVVQGIYETLALALLTTVLGAALALPISFLAANNLMGGHPLTIGIYFLVRTLLNLLRSIESLIFGIIFVIIVGLGPFAGMLALTLHTIAALGKLYSEVIEGIDPGPIEAIRATGGTWAQVVRYAVVPQIVPPFIGLTIYRWDINVRSSTIIGFVGGGGIGFFLFQWINLGDYRAVSGAFIAIAVVVFLMDFFSARLRERLQ